MRTALITGAAGTFGSVLTRSFHARDWNVIATARHIPEAPFQGKAGQCSSGSGRVEWMKLDVTNAADRSKVISSDLDMFGSIDVLVNNASGYSSGSLIDITEEMIDADYDATVKGPLLLTQDFLKHALKRGQGKVFFISSISGIPSEPDHGKYGVYASNKAAIARFSECLHEDLKGTSLSSTVLFPCSMRDYPDGNPRLKEENAITMQSVADALIDIASTEGRASIDKVVFRP